MSIRTNTVGGIVSFYRYKRRVESTKYRDFSISLSEVAKYPGELKLEYKYQISCPNWKESGMPGARIVSPSRPPFSPRPFKGLDKVLFDDRIQFSKAELLAWLREIADKVRYGKDADNKTKKSV